MHILNDTPPTQKILRESGDSLPLDRRPSPPSCRQSRRSLLPPPVSRSTKKMQGWRPAVRLCYSKFHEVLLKKWICSEAMALPDAQFAASFRDAHTIKSICRILESQVWGPNTEPLLKPYIADLSPHVSASVVLQQKSLSMAKDFFAWSSRAQAQPHPAYVYHALLIKLGEAKHINEMWQLLQDMQEKVCATSFSILLKTYALAGLAHLAMYVVNRAHREFNVRLDVHLYTSVLSVLLKAKKFRKAKMIFSQMIEEKCEFDASAWSTLIRGFGKNGCITEAEQCWEAMLNSGFEPTVNHYNALIEGLCDNDGLDKALCIFSAFKPKGLIPNAYTYNPILLALCKAGRFSQAFTMFLRMKNACLPNQATYNMLLEGLFWDTDVTKAVELYDWLEKEGCADSRTYSLVASGLRRVGNLAKLTSISEQLHTKNGIVNVWLCNALLHCLCDKSDIGNATTYYNRMLNGLTQPDAATFGIMINGYCKSMMIDDAMKVLSTMVGLKLNPNEFCYSPLIVALLKSGRVRDSLIMFNEMINKGLEPMAPTCDFLVRELSEAGMADEAIQVCDRIVRRSFHVTAGTASSLMDCLQKVGRQGQAWAVFEALKKQGCFLDGSSMGKALKVLKGAGSLEKIASGCTG